MPVLFSAKWTLASRVGVVKKEKKIRIMYQNTGKQAKKENILNPMDYSWEK